VRDSDGCHSPVDCFEVDCAVAGEMFLGQTLIKPG